MLDTKNVRVVVSHKMDGWIKLWKHEINKQTLQWMWMQNLSIFLSITFNSNEKISTGDTVQEHNGQQKNMGKPFAWPAANFIVQIKYRLFTMVEPTLGPIPCEILQSRKLLEHIFAGIHGILINWWKRRLRPLWCSVAEIGMCCTQVRRSGFIVTALWIWWRYLNFDSRSIGAQDCQPCARRWRCVRWRWHFFKTKSKS